MTDDQIVNLAGDHWSSIRGPVDDCEWAFDKSDLLNFARALLAAGASEGQADHPLDIRAYIVTDRSSGAKALKWAAELGNRFPSELYQLIPLTHHADAVAELTALREQIAGMEKDARDAGPTAWRYETDYGTIYQSTQLDHTYADANGDYIKGTPLYLAPCPSTTKFEPATRVVMTYEGENFSDVDRALPFGTPLFTAAQMRQAERDALERAAALIEPKNDMDDWTDWARTRYEAAQQIRGLKEPKQ